MKLTQKSILAVILFGFTVLNAQAEDSKDIYKWKDKDGAVRYTDMPPPNGTKNVVKIKGKSGSAIAQSAGTSDAPAVKGGVTTQTVEKKDDLSPEALAKKRRELEEVEKKNKAEKALEAKNKQMNCAAAKSNYASYSQGGRVYKTNENGERVYLDDQALQDGAAQAKREMQENCS